MKLSKAWLLDQLTVKSPKELATEIVKKQVFTGGVPVGYELQYDATVQKYTSMLEKLVLEEMRLA